MESKSFCIKNAQMSQCFICVFGESNASLEHFFCHMVLPQAPLVMNQEWGD